MDRRTFANRISQRVALAGLSLGAVAAPQLAQAGDTAPVLRGTGDLGIIIERAVGKVQVVVTSSRTSIATVSGLGDLSHASAVFSRDGRYAYVFGRDGGLSKIDLLTGTLAKRIIQAGNSIGGAISQDGRFVAAQNYQPGGVRGFDAATLEPVATITASTAMPVKLQRWSDWPMHRAWDLFLPCLTREKSGWPTCPPTRHSPV